MVETSLPEAAVLIEAARQAADETANLPGDPVKAAERRRQAASRALDQWKPAIDELTDFTGAARFLGVRDAGTLRRRQFRVRLDGTKGWADPDAKLGGRKGWRLRTIVLHEALSPTRGPRAMDPHAEAGDAEVYLSTADLAVHFGVAASTMHGWRSRYRPGRDAEALRAAPSCPQPDVYVGVGKPQAGWKQDRLPEWDEWHASMPGQGAGGGRPRSA